MVPIIICKLQILTAVCTTVHKAIHNSGRFSDSIGKTLDDQCIKSTFLVNIWQLVA